MKMAGMTRRSSLGNSQIHKTQDSLDRLRRLYPAVIDPENTLPRSWSPKDKHNFIGLTQNDLRVHYKGVGKTHKDAASVRATQPIPAACGIYYFEIKIISKGRDGPDQGQRLARMKVEPVQDSILPFLFSYNENWYVLTNILEILRNQNRYMGIGLSAQGINMNRLPGWDKLSYGYHGDDGHSFCSSGTGQPYGPTFTTGDVIGCCVNLIDCTCFYTKNGISLGIAFRELPSYLYPTVGLQTPGEVIEANFGQTPFVYDIEDYVKEWHMKTRQTVERFPIPERMGEWQTMLHKIVSTYLVHHGYCATAESFARNTDQGFEEELKSIKNRQRIQKLVLAGRMGEAIETTQQLYPGLLERNTNLLFMLKCRQFIEMVNGTDSEVRGTAIHSPKSHHGSSNSGTGSNRSTPSVSPMHYSAAMPAATSSQHMAPPARCSSPSGHIITKGHSALHISTQQNAAIDLRTISEEEMNLTNCVRNGDGDTANGATVRLEDIDMDTSESISDERTISSNGTVNGACTNGTSVGESHQDDMEVDPPVSRRQLCGGIPTAVQKMLQFGRQLHSMGEQLKREFGTNHANKKALLDAFSLLAYADPWSSPVGHQLDPVEREPVCAALNSAILESHGLPKQPPLELAIGQASACMHLMSKANIGSCAFISVGTYLQH